MATVEQLTDVLTAGVHIAMPPAGPYTGRPRNFRGRTQRSCSQRRHEACQTSQKVAPSAPTDARRGHTSRSRGPARGSSMGKRVPPATTLPPPATIDMSEPIAFEAPAQCHDSAEEATGTLIPLQSDDGDSDDDVLLACLSNCAGGIVEGLLYDAVDDYSDEAAYMYEMEAPTVYPAMEPSIPEDEAAELMVAEEELIRQGVNEDIADALTLSLFFDAASDLRVSDEIDEDAVSVGSFAVANDILEQDEAAQSMSNDIVWGSTGADQAGEGDSHAKHTRMKLRNALEDALDDGSLHSVLGDWAKMQKQLQEERETDRIRNKLRMALESSLDNDSLQTMLRKCSVRQAAAPAECLLLKASELEPCTRSKLARRFRPRLCAAPVPEEPFPMDCLPISAPVARETTPEGEIQMHKQRQRTDQSSTKPPLTSFFASGWAKQFDLPLSDAAKELLTKSAGSALQELERAARAEASETIQSCVRKVLATSQFKPRQDAERAARAEACETIQSCVLKVLATSQFNPVQVAERAARAEASETMQAPPTSPSSGSSARQAGRRCIMGLGAASEQTVVVAAPPAVESARAVPMPPSAPKTARPGARPMPGLSSAARGVQQPTLVPQPPAAPKEGMAAPHRQVRPTASPSVAAPVPDPLSAAQAAANVSIWAGTPAVLPPPTPRGGRRPAQAGYQMEDKPEVAPEQPKSAMALDLGSAAAPSMPRATTSAMPPKPQWSLPAASPRMSKAAGTGLLPALPINGVSAATMSWSKTAVTPRSACGLKSTDRPLQGSVTPRHFLHGE